MTSVFSWQNSQSLLCFILYSKAKFVCYSRYLLTSYFCIPVPCDEKDIIFWCYFQKVLQVVFIEPFNLIFFSISGWGIDLDYCDTEWFALETYRDHSVVFETGSKCCMLDSFVHYVKQQAHWKSKAPKVRTRVLLPARSYSQQERGTWFSGA